MWPNLLLTSPSGFLVTAAVSSWSDGPSEGRFAPAMAGPGGLYTERFANGDGAAPGIPIFRDMSVDGLTKFVVAGRALT